MKTAEKAVHIVDRQKEKSKAVNKKVNKAFQKKQDEWNFIPVFYIDFMKLLGNLFYIPVVLVIAMMEGVRAGFIRGMEKALAMYKVS